MNLSGVAPPVMMNPRMIDNCVRDLSTGGVTFYSLKEGSTFESFLENIKIQ